MAGKLINLNDILPDVVIDFDRYYQSETETITPALEAKGYQLTSFWWSSEKDSFGPLSRSVEALTPEGELIQIFYG